jgi:hypothetical protein
MEVHLKLESVMEGSGSVIVYDITVFLFWWKRETFRPLDQMHGTVGRLFRRHA